MARWRAVGTAAAMIWIGYTAMVWPVSRQLERELIACQIELDWLSKVQMTAKDRVYYHNLKLKLASVWIAFYARNNPDPLTPDAPDIDTVFESYRLPLIRLPDPPSPIPAPEYGIPSPPDPPFWTQFGQELSGFNLNQLTISGVKTIIMSARSDTINWVRQETLQLAVAGTAAGATINVAIDQNSAGGESDNKTQVDIRHPHGHAVMGQYQTQFTQLDLLRYDAQLDGVQADVTFNPITIGGVLSSTRGDRARQYIVGNNSQGPFLLNERPVMVGSDVVMLNGQALQRNVDYQIDYAAGSIRMLTRVLTPDDRLGIQYESDSMANRTTVMGLKGRYQLGSDAAVGGVVMQRRARQVQSDQTVWSQHDIIVVDSDWAAASSSVHAELAHTRQTTNAQSNQGLAAAIRGQHSTDTSAWSLALMGAQDGVVSVDTAGVSGGDYRLSGAGTVQLGSTQVSGLTDTRRQRVSDQPLIDRDTALSVNTNWDWVTTRVNTQWIGHTELTSANVLVSQTDRHITAVSAGGRAGIGQYQTGLSHEIKSTTSGSADQSIQQADATYTVSSDTRWDAAVSGWIRQISDPGHRQSEQKARVSGSFRPDNTTSLSGVGEYRGVSDSDPITMLQIAADTRHSNFTVNGTVGLESLKESISSQLIDVSQWDWTVRTTLEPLSILRVKSNWRVVGKWPKSSDLPVFYNRDWSGDITFQPVNWINLSVQQRHKAYQRGVMTDSAGHGYIDSADDANTLITRGVLNWGQTALTGHYETDDRSQSRTVATADQTQAVTTTTTQRVLGAISHQWQAFGLGCDVEWRRSLSQTPTVSIAASRLATGIIEWRATPWMTLKTTAGYAETQDTESFYSTRYGGEVSCRWSAATLLLTYNRTDEFRIQSTPWRVAWGIESRIDIHANASFTLSASADLDPNAQNWAATSRLTVTL